MGGCPTAIDLYAGCGGWTLGALHGGFDVRAAWETNREASYTYHVELAQQAEIAQHGDATVVDAAKLPNDLDAAFMGPPCQGISSSGGTIDPDDPRNEHLLSCIEWVEVGDPRLVVIENVGALEHRHGDLLHDVERTLANAGDGYAVQTIRMNAADYGVPQARERVFVIGVRHDLTEPDRWCPPPTHRGSQARMTEFLTDGSGLEGFTTAREAFEDGGDGPLPDPLVGVSPDADPVHTSIDAVCGYRDEYGDRHRVDPHSLPAVVERDGEHVWMPTCHVAPDHSHEVREKYAEWELGLSGSRTTERRLHPDEPAPTVTHSDGVQPVHYVGRSPSTPDEPVEEVRRLTVREMARLQTFPDRFAFAGTRAEQSRQVANAVPPAMGATLAGHLRAVVLD